MQRGRVTKRLTFTDNERYSHAAEPRYLHGELGMDRRPMFHHYSWVHDRETMLAKVLAWAHRGDRDWVGQVEEEFKREFDPAKDRDFVHGYEYAKVEPFVEVGL